MQWKLTWKTHKGKIDDGSETETLMPNEDKLVIKC
jgi:hypothetical protein